MEEGLHCPPDPLLRRQNGKQSTFSFNAENIIQTLCSLGWEVVGGIDGVARWQETYPVRFPGGGRSPGGPLGVGTQEQWSLPWRAFRTPWGPCFKGTLSCVCLSRERVGVRGAWDLGSWTGSKLEEVQEEWARCPRSSEAAPCLLGSPPSPEF